VLVLRGDRGEELPGQRRVEPAREIVEALQQRRELRRAAWPSRSAFTAVAARAASCRRAAPRRSATARAARRAPVGQRQRAPRERGLVDALHHERRLAGGERGAVVGHELLVGAAGGACAGSDATSAAITQRTITHTAIRYCIGTPARSVRREGASE